MSYESVDALQKVLVEKVFHYAEDRKKAAGRALGTLVDPTPELAAARKAFLQSYDGKSSGNRFTKVKIDVNADLVLRSYFEEHAKKIESWFNIITPKKKPLSVLQDELRKLDCKNWAKILSV
jgi:hypothetical protein